jgi:hypothetical protein|tara:strand:+ start:1996 stop:2217 length:222 start_codon:yes stop_codon:yes gene_type:complete
MKLIDQVNQIQKDARLALIKKFALKKRKLNYSNAMKGLDDNAPSIATENAPSDLKFNREKDDLTKDLMERIFG